MDRKRLRHVLIALLVVIILSPPIYGDIYWESVIATSGMPAGLPGNVPPQMLAQFNRTDMAKNYLTASASRTDTSDGIMIMDFDAKTMYQLNTADKTYTKVNMMSVMTSPIGKGMIKGMTDDMKIIPSNETKTIAGYKCKKYTVTMMGSESEYWLSKDVKGYPEFRSIAKKMEDLFIKNPSLRQTCIAAMAGKLDGFPVQTVISVMGITTTTTLKSIEEKPLSNDLFKVPKGYKLITLPGK